jgi:hypothetical protein
MKNASQRLSEMNQEKNNVRIDKRNDNAKVVKDLTEEKKKVETKYSTMLVDVHKFMDYTIGG